MFLVTVGVVLLTCACFVCYSHLPTEGNVTREREVAKQLSCMSPRSMQADDIDHVKERTWILSWCSGDQLWQLMMLNTRSFFPLGFCKWSKESTQFVHSWARHAPVKIPEKSRRLIVTFRRPIVNFFRFFMS